ncbi:MAG: hypothetical protein BGO21_14750 [Dyadobacter sp. 50-39]|uniref:BatA domain-containing protein n=1 Tax=Dyadobacter sp. 50-39 TaxID=1895756 RepID=UPI00095D2DF5|nr:BatA domain-containing protein [Dyadobacter sp. 50-39]OJV18069.1 MAG: hypothetical protein BGO21_14750 [Dyadobacter sp. 50-39]
MAFLQPYMLWGMLAAAVPVAIHFWYQKRGKTIEWAAMRWLGEQTTLQHRGIRLNEVWLMLLRCLLVALAALILSKPVMEAFRDRAGAATIHLVEPDRLVTDTYRFELEKALREGEKVYWLGNMPAQVTSLSEMPANRTGFADMQQNINALSGDQPQTFKLYFGGYIAPDALRKVYIPGAYQLFPATDSSRGQPVSLWKKKPVYGKPLRILLENGDNSERQTIRAALGALSEVYGFVFKIDSKKEAGKHADWVFTNEPVHHAEAGTKYIVSGVSPEWNARAQVKYLPDSLKLSSSGLVESGRFPEWLGNLIVKDLGLQPTASWLSRAQLTALFERVEMARGQREAALRPWLLLTFVILLTAERWLALRKTRGSNG